MASVSDRNYAHGFGKCAEICEGCYGEGEVKGRPCTRCSGNGTEKRAA